MAPPTALAALLAGSLLVSTPAETLDVHADLEFAIEAIGREAADLLRLKEIDWEEETRPLLREAKKAKTPSQHASLLLRLLAKLRDGHAELQPLVEVDDVTWPEALTGERTGPGMFLCRVEDRVFVKNAWSGAAALGLAPGMEVLELDGDDALEWLERRAAELGEWMGFSTDHQAFFYACHWGLKAPPGTRLKVEFEDLEGKKRKRTIDYTKASYVPWGPAFAPEGMQGEGDVFWGRTEQGYGYVHFRRSPGDLPQQLDRALADLGDVPGMILDVRGNSGGGFDHEALLGRFVPRGKELAFAKRYASAGEHPYGGPVVLIVDATARSSGETLAAIFKEDGRAYAIGESPTAGMSAVKTKVPLPSGRYELYFAVRSNMARSNDGRGLEGVGLVPHELLAFDPADLAAERDTFLLRAEALLAAGLPDVVPYRPEEFGWSPD